MQAWGWMPGPETLETCGGGGGGICKFLLAGGVTARWMDRYRLPSMVILAEARKCTLRLSNPPNTPIGKTGLAPSKPPGEKPPEG